MVTGSLLAFVGLLALGSPNSETTNRNYSFSNVGVYETQLEERGQGFYELDEGKDFGGDAGPDYNLIPRGRSHS